MLKNNENNCENRAKSFTKQYNDGKMCKSQFAINNRSVSYYGNFRTFRRSRIDRLLFSRVYLFDFSVLSRFLRFLGE